MGHPQANFRGDNVSTLTSSMLTPQAAVCVMNPPCLEALNKSDSGREEWITLACVQSDRAGRVTADLLASLCNSWQERRRPNLLLPTLDAPFYPARADVAIMHAGWA